MDQQRIEQALRLLECIEGWHEFEHGLIDPSDWQRFTAYDLLLIAEGVTTPYNLEWGIGDPPATPEERAELERAALAKWQGAA